jgi:hypothetical protein
MLKVAEQHQMVRCAQIVPILFAGTELGSAVLISRIAQLKNLMDVKGDQVEYEKVYRQVALAMAEVVFNMITLIFQCIKGLIFNFPADPTGLDQQQISRYAQKSRYR